MGDINKRKSVKYGIKDIWEIYSLEKNIARGTTDPGYRVYNLSYLSSLIECHLQFQIWPIVCGSTCISSKFDHQVAPGDATSIGPNFGQHVLQLALVPILATRWCYLH